MSSNRVVHYRNRPVFLAVLVGVLTTGFVRGETPRLLWQDVVDRGNFDQAFDV
jgi:hypothetical protein